MPTRTRTQPEASSNRLLAGLPPRKRRAFAGHCEPVALTFGDVLSEPDDEIEYVYFPLTGFISVMVPAEAGASLEVGLIGREVMLGATIALGVDSSPLHGFVQGAGIALRMTAAQFRRQLDALPELRASILRYSYVLLRQVSQMAACTRYHTVEQRLARWLLMTQDRARGAEFHLTQEFLGLMLGVRRVGVTHAAGALQARGLIGYRRGEIVVANRHGLIAASCQCYASDKKLYQRTLG